MTIVPFLLPIRPRPQRNNPGLTQRRLCFDIWAAFTIPLEQLQSFTLPWALDEVMCGFTALTEVDILCTTNLAVRDCLDDNATRTLQQVLLQLHAKGILHIADVTGGEH